MVRGWSWLLLCALLWSGATYAAAATLNELEALGEPGAPVFRALDIDLARDDSLRVPTVGWERSAIGIILADRALNPGPSRVHALWGRVRFDRSRISARNLALYTDGNREQLIVWLNGREIFRNFSPGDRRRVEGWYRPYVVDLPPELLRAGENTLTLRADSNYNLSVGDVVIGDAAALRDRYNFVYFWRIDATMAATAATALLCLLALIAWTQRRYEPELLFLGLSGLLWLGRNFHFFVMYQPFDPRLLAHITLFCSYMAPVSSAAFCAYFLRIPARQRIVIAMAGVGIVATVLNIAGILVSLYVYILALLVGVATTLLVAWDMRSRRTPDHWVILSIMLFVELVCIHDIRRESINLWDGVGFFIQPFFGLLFAVGFLLSFGARALRSFNAEAALNRDLEQRIEIARQDLIDSEEKRRQLEVDAAVGSERERLMREMHDGIGSNLVMALAVAEKQNQPKSTITTLRRALSDLRITVDSLEQFGGDLVALLGNFRHRLQPELKRAGVTTRWRVEPCPPLLWLDATNALHVMRFFQEALGNALTHADATEIEIGCHPETRDGTSGVTAWLADNGRGFDVTEAREGGKGLANMAARARALQGSMDVASDPATGTRLAIWLPEQQLGYTEGAGAAQPQIVRVE
jgi:signal transduction histidine kinase